jgi:hypothetical protein
MANYYPLLASVIAAVEGGSAEFRRRLYQSARTGFLEQMRKHEPPLSDSYIKQEQIALEEAIRKVEAEKISRLGDYSETVEEFKRPREDKPAQRKGGEPGHTEDSAASG